MQLYSPKIKKLLILSNPNLKTFPSTKVLIIFPKKSALKKFLIFSYILGHGTFWFQD